MAGISFTKVIDSGPSYTTVEASDGQTYTFKGLPGWRNNNPGNIVYGSYAKAHGAIGQSNGYAVFPDQQTGSAAQYHLQFVSPAYKNKTISEAMSSYAPTDDGTRLNKGNNPGSYAAMLANALGVPTSTKLSELNAQQQQTYLAAQRQFEGVRPGTIMSASGSVSPDIVQQFNGAPLPPRDIPASASVQLASIHDQNADWPSAPPLPIPRPAPPVASAPNVPLPRARPASIDNGGFNMAPPNVPLNAAMPGNRGASYGPQTGQWAPKIGQLGMQAVPQGTLTASGSAPTRGITGAASLVGSAAPKVPSMDSIGNGPSWASLSAYTSKPAAPAVVRVASLPSVPSIPAAPSGGFSLSGMLGGLGSGINNALGYAGNGVQAATSAIAAKAPQIEQAIIPAVMGSVAGRSAFIDPMINRIGSPTAGQAGSPTRYGDTFAERQAAAAQRDALANGTPMPFSSAPQAPMFPPTAPTPYPLPSFMQPRYMPQMPQQHIVPSVPQQRPNLFASIFSPAPRPQVYAVPQQNNAPVNQPAYQRGLSDLQASGMVDQFGMITGSNEKGQWH